MLISLLVAAGALIVSYIVYSPTTDGPVTALVSTSTDLTGAEDQKADIEQIESPIAESSVVEPSTAVAEKDTVLTEAGPTDVTQAQSEYKVGRFDAPEQLQIAVYQGLNEVQANYSTYLDDMRCESGDCEIVIRVETLSGRSVADLVERINGHLEENVLTADIIIGLRRLEMVDKGVARVELVTTPRSQKDAEAARR